VFAAVVWKNSVRTLWTILLSLWLAAPAGACEILVKATNATHQDTEEDRRGCYKRGMMVLAMPDGHIWGTRERLPHFVVIKIPGVPVERVLKYFAHQFQGTDAQGNPINYRRRLWQIRWADLPLAARNKLASSGELTIKVGTYAGAYDYTWEQLKIFIRNLLTGLDEIKDL